MTLRRLLLLAAVAEIITGIALLLAPALALALLLGAEASGEILIVCRVVGIALVGLGTACVPGPASGATSVAAYRGMVIYGALTAAYFAFVAIGLHRGGPLLWPAVAYHALITLLLAYRRRMM